MKLLAILCFVGLALIAHGFTVRELLTGVKADTDESEVSCHHHHHHHHHHGHKGHCKCDPFGCWCHAVDAGMQDCLQLLTTDSMKEHASLVGPANSVLTNPPIIASLYGYFKENLFFSVHADLSVLEVRHCDCDKTVIDGTFYIGKESFTKEFPVDEFEDFCEIVHGKEFCFRIDVQDAKSGRLKGSIGLTRPQKVDMGCFSLPLMTSQDSLDSIQDGVDEESDVSVIEMESPTELDTDSVEHKSKCMCCPHGCRCKGSDDGYKVLVILSVDECHHDGTTHALIVGFFRVGKDTFYKTFHEQDLDDFCHEDECKEFCFNITANRVCSGDIAGHIELFKPKKVDLGWFSLPLLTSSNVNDDNTLADDNFAEEENAMPYQNGVVEENENEIFIDE